MRVRFHVLRLQAKCTFGEEELVENDFTVIVLRILKVRKLQKKVLLVLVHPEIETHFTHFFLGLYSPHFLHQNLNRKLKVCMGLSFWRTIISIPFAGFSMVGSFQKTLTILISLDLLTQFCN